MFSDSKKTSHPKAKKPYKKPNLTRLDLNNLTEKQAKMVAEIEKKRKQLEKDQS